MTVPPPGRGCPLPARSVRSRQPDCQPASGKTDGGPRRAQRRVGGRGSCPGRPEAQRRSSSRVLNQDPVSVRRRRRVSDPGWPSPDPRPLRLPAEHLQWVSLYAEVLVRRAPSGVGLLVVGDLADLVPEDWADPGRPFDDVTDGELLEAAEVALAALALGHGHLFRRYRRAFLQREGRPTHAAGGDGERCPRRRVRRAEGRVSPDPRQPAAGPGAPRVRRPDLGATYTGAKTEPGTFMLNS